MYIPWWHFVFELRGGSQPHGFSWSAMGYQGLLWVLMERYRCSAISKSIRATTTKGYAFQPLLIANYSLLIAYVSNKINQGVYI